MTLYRFYLCNADGHFLRVQEVECADSEIKVTALRMVKDAPDYVVAVEVWEKEKRLARVER